MQLTVKGKQLDVGNALRQHVETRLTDTVKKYFNNPIEATVVFSREGGHLFRADISIHVGRNIVLQTHHAAEDPYPAFDTATDRMSKRLRRYKEKLRDHHFKISDLPDDAHLAAKYYTLQHAFDQEDEPVEGGDEPAIVAEMHTMIQTMTVSDAVMRMDLGDLNALMFRNAGHGGLNMVYRRKDGNIGWVDPAGNNKTVVPKAVAPKAGAKPQKPASRPVKSVKPVKKKRK